MPVWLQHGAILAAVGAGFGYLGRRMQRVEVHVNGRLSKAIERGERLERELREIRDDLARTKKPTRRKGTSS